MKATRFFTKADFICEYAGDLISYKEAKERESKYENQNAVGCYMYYFMFKNERMWYVLELEK